MAGSDYCRDFPYIDLKSTCPCSLHTGLSVVLGAPMNKICDMSSVPLVPPLWRSFPSGHACLSLHQAWLWALSTILWVGSGLCSWNRTIVAFSPGTILNVKEHIVIILLSSIAPSVISRNLVWFVHRCMNKSIIITPILLWAVDFEIKNAICPQ